MISVPPVENLPIKSEVFQKNNFNQSLELFLEMIRQLLVSTEGDADRLRVTSRIIAGPLAKGDVSAAFENLFRPQNDAALRAASYHLISVALRDGIWYKQVETRLFGFIDQLPGALACITTGEEASAFLDVLEALIDIENEDCVSRIEKCFTKVVSL